MAEEIIRNRMNCIMRQDEIGRIRLEKIEGGEMAVIADVHGMSKAAARRFIKNIIAIIRNRFLLFVIHGYRHGTAIKDMIWNREFQNSRIFSINEVSGNMGETMLKIAKAC